MRIIVDIDTSNAAFEDAFEYQIRSILKKVTIAITADNLVAKQINDMNGNKVGSFRCRFNDLPDNVKLSSAL